MTPIRSVPDFDDSYLQRLGVNRPHVVLLGAGASRAACPRGDKHGCKLPLLTEIVDEVGLAPILDSASIREDRNDFEALYSNLVSSDCNTELVSQIEQAVFGYFASLELPDEPTLYDHLVLSLREKDIIATFNWDPLLVQAVIRNSHVGPMPSTLHLHGNVAIGYCMEHKPITVGSRGQVCPKCRLVLQESRLLFPVTQKKYQCDPFVAKCWELLQAEMRAGYLLTIFGYRAPDTDVEAKKLLEEGWNAARSQQYKTIEIIDIREEDELCDTWRAFFQSGYYQTHKDFYSSMLAHYPRRSCESVFSAEIDCNPVSEKTIPRTEDWEELHAWFAPLIEAEQP